MISQPAYPARPQPRERSITVSLGHHWHRIALLAVVALSAILNFVGLSREGYDNQFYAAAVRSMAESWHTFFFSSFDPGGFVTIDKPPVGFWFQVASVKLFGFSGLSLLLPEALAGVLSVILLYHLVARSFGRAAGLIAALALAVTPISVVTARNNTIDSLLVLVVLVAAWAVLKAAETGKLRWLLLCAALVGVGFNIKMLEAYLVVPAFGLVYLLGTHKSIWRRLGNLFLALIVLLVVSLSWVIAVDLTPAGQRPFVDSTTTNSALDLAVGYNGLQRLTGNSGVGGAGRQSRPPGFASIATSRSKPATPSSGGANQGPTGGPGGSGGGPGGVGENGPTGVLRLLDVQLASQIGWLLPLALLGIVVGLWQSRLRFRILDDRQRSIVLWGVWRLTMGAFFSVALFYHTYYLTMMAPAVSALAGIAIASAWREYRRPGSRTWWLLPFSLLAAAGVEAHILTVYPPYARWLSPLVVSGCVVGAICLLFFRLRPFSNLRAAAVGATLGSIALMAPATAFAAYTTQHTETGNIARAGPAAAGVSGGFGGFGGPQRGLSFRPGRTFGAPTGGFPGSAPPAGRFGPPPGAAGLGGPRNGPAFGGDVSSALIRYLVKHRGSAKYIVATPSSNQAAPIIIATGEPVMSLGGFTGSDPILTTSQLAKLATEGVVRYFLLGGGGGPGGSSSLTAWVQQHSRLITVAGTQLYEYTGE